MTLEKTVAGDILYSESFGECRLWKVDRVTPKFVICGSTKFNRNGRSCGEDSWNRIYVYPATPDKLEKAKRQGLIRDIRRAAESRNALENLDTTILETIAHHLGIRP